MQPPTALVAAFSDATSEVAARGRADLVTVASMPAFARVWLMPRLKTFLAVPVGARVHGRHGGDVGHRQPLHRIGVVQRQPMRNLPAAIVADHGEAGRPEEAHQLDLVLGHGAFGAVHVAGPARRLRRIALAAQVGRHDGEPLGEPRGDLVPGEQPRALGVAGPLGLLSRRRRRRPG
jgi:hypothetical protein